MPALPTGTVTFLFTDIEGSTRLLEHLGDRYADALTQYQHLLCSAVQERGGQQVDTQGDAFFFAFPRARDAVAAAVAAQQGILRHPWTDGVSIRFIMLTGSGGAGKTRLALRAAAEVLEGSCRPAETHLWRTNDIQQLEDLVKSRRRNTNVTRKRKVEH